MRKANPKDHIYDDDYDDYGYGGGGYGCPCESCINDKKKQATKSNLGRAAKARIFVDTILAKLDDWIGEEKYSECKIINNPFVFSNPRKYFVHVQHERNGVFSGEGRFMNKSEIISILQHQVEPNDVILMENRIIIFDTDLNKVIKPKIVL